MKTNVERIKDFLDRFNIDPSVFEKNAEISNGIIANNLKNKGKFSDKTLEKILKSNPEIRKEWLVFGEGEMLYSDSPEIKKPEITQAELDALIKENQELKAKLADLSLKVYEILNKK
jgi:hypothetical protein